jgi:NhaP-type Na+/H+ and K+/H+ antiporter
VIALLTVGLILIGYSAVSGPVDRRGITSAMVFVAVGFIVGASGMGWLDVPPASTVAERITELALVFLLFSDWARIDLRSLRHDLAPPGAGGAAFRGQRPRSAGPCHLGSDRGRRGWRAERP